MLRELLRCSTFLIVFFAEVARGDPASTACTLLAAALPPDRVAHPLSVQYAQDIDHWAGSSEQRARCTVEPASAAEVATILHVINQTRTPWAVKGGGHAYNAGFSATPGVQIALARFDDVTYDAGAGTAHIGAGLAWDDVYAVLAPLGVGVAGGRVPGVGVGGFALGGGYAWHTQQVGLTIDTAVAFDLVTPTGNIMTVTDASDPDLFFGLRGGGNNFGIVTGFTLRTFPQSDVYGGAVIYAGDLDAVTAAIVDFDATNTDPKAAILATYTAIALTLEAVVFLFYDAPTPPAGTFAAFLAIPAVSNSVHTQPFPAFVQSLGLSPDPPRVGAHTVPIVQYTRPIVDAIIDQTRALGVGTLFATVSIESFTRTLYDHSAGGAYPHSAAHPWTPCQVLAAWALPARDTALRARVLASAAAIRSAAIAEGQSSTDAVLYNNYAMAGTPLAALYGANVPALAALRALVDPDDLGSLTGGWRF